MRVLITGVAGFIGSNLAIELLRQNHHVIGIDNLSQGSILNIKSILNNKNFEFLNIDICNYRKLLSATSKCDVIVHLAAYKIPRYSDALDTLTINSRGCENLIKIAKKQKIKIIAASTSDVYGKNPKLPFSEDDDMVIGSPKVRRWAYAISKMFEEQLYFAYHERYGLDVVLLRFFGGYGPNQNLSWWGGPQSVFINSAIEKKPLEIHGTGKQTRSFTYITDHVDGIIRCINSDAANNRVINIGNTREITIENLGILVWNLVQPNIEPLIKFIPYSTFGNYEDVQRRIPDITLAKELLGFQPRVDLEEGLRLTIEWQKYRRVMEGI